MKNLFAIVAILMLTSCAGRPKVVAIQPIVSVPGVPYLPMLSDSELGCLSDSTYERLAKRDQAWKHYSETLIELLK